jgi:hypothetical protein
LCAGKSSATKCSGLRRWRIMRPSSATNSFALSARSYRQY